MTIRPPARDVELSNFVNFLSLQKEREGVEILIESCGVEFGKGR